MILDLDGSSIYSRLYLVIATHLIISMHRNPPQLTFFSPRLGPRTMCRDATEAEYRNELESPVVAMMVWPVVLDTGDQ